MFQFEFLYIPTSIKIKVCIMYRPPKFILSSLERERNSYSRLNYQSTTDFINYKGMPASINLMQSR